MSLETAKLADCSSLRFIYPFTFQPETFDQREQAIDTNAGVWLPAAFPVGETLSHVADYLKPPEGQPRAARLWKLSAQNHNPLRLTPDIRGSIIAGKREIPFTFGGSQKNSSVIELALFRIGVGFLTVTVRPADPDVGAWLAFLHYFRVMGGSHNVSLRLLDTCGHFSSPQRTRKAAISVTFWTRFSARRHCRRIRRSGGTTSSCRAE